jgi:hypothetical protein
MTQAYLEARGSSILVFEYTDENENNFAQNNFISYVGMFCRNLYAFTWDCGHDCSNITAVARGCPLLEILHVRGRLTNDAIKEFSQNCRHVKRAAIQALTRTLSPETLTHCVQNWHVLDTICVSLEHRTRISDTFLVTLALSCPLLTVVKLLNTNISAVGLNALATHCEQLHFAWFGGKISIAGSLDAAGFPSLRVLHLVDMDILDDSFDALLCCCPGLLTLWLSSLPYISSAGIKAAARRCPLLQTLHLYGVYCLQDEDLIDLADQFSLLRSFSSTSFNRFSGAAICAMIRGHPLLEELTVSGNDELLESVLHCLANHCPNLRRVDVSACYGLKDASILALLQGCPRLTCVRIDNSYRLEKETKRLLKQLPGPY